MAEEWQLPHQLLMEERRKLTVSGVSDVDSFDERIVVVDTSEGELTVRGEQLQIHSLNVDTGELILSGKIESLAYAEPAGHTGGFFGKLFR